MNEFTRFLAETALVADRQIQYYVGCVQQAYELAGTDVGAPLRGKAEKTALTRLQQRCEDWKGRQARHALRHTFALPEGGGGLYTLYFYR